MKSKANKAKTFWKNPDTRLGELLSFIGDEQQELSNNVQSVLNQFREIEMKGYLPKSEVERLHRAIRRWERGEYDEGEMRLWMNDLKNRRKIRGEEALFIFLFAAMLESYRTVANKSAPLMEEITRSAYNQSFAKAYSITGKGKNQKIGDEFVQKALKSVLPSGSNFYSGLENDAHYRARQLKEQVASNMIQGNPLSMDSPEFKRIMNSQRQWQLRRTHSTSSGGYAGYYDMVTSFMVHTAVAQAYRDARVKEYRFIAVIDDATTSTCKELNGHVFKMSEMKIGINFPPTYPPPHPCRSITEPIK